MLKRLCMLYAIREDELDQLLRRHVFVDLLRPSARPCASASRATASRRSRSSRASCAPPRSVAVRTRCSSTSTTSARATSSTAGDRELQRRGLPRDRGGVRLAARPGARRRRRGSRRRRSAGRGGGARTERARAAARASSSRARRRAASAGSPASCSRTTAAQRSSSGGRIPAQGDDTGAAARRQRGARGPRVAPAADGRRKSLAHPMSYPPQEHKSRAGGREDPETGSGVTIDALDEDAASSGSSGEAGSTDVPPACGHPERADRDDQAPGALHASPSRSAIERPWITRAARLLPTTAGVGRGAGHASRRRTSTVARLALGLDESTLVIQGPPGTGKTYRGARLITELVRAGSASA